MIHVCNIYSKIKDWAFNFSFKGLIHFSTLRAYAEIYCIIMPLDNNILSFYKCCLMPKGVETCLTSYQILRP